MGKKKVVKKTKPLSVAIAESSSSIGVESIPQLQTPRKRGRPRKVAERSDDDKKEEEEEEERDVEEGKESKKVRSGEGEKGEQTMIKEVETTSVSPKKREEGQSEEGESFKEQQHSRSRARRKSKPRKSS